MYQMDLSQDILCETNYVQGRDVSPTENTNEYYYEKSQDEVLLENVYREKIVSLPKASYYTA